MRFVCQVRRGDAVTTVELQGTLSESAAMDAVVTLQGCLADEQPATMVLDVTELTIPASSALIPLSGLAERARQWPGTRLVISGASDVTRSRFSDAIADGHVDFFDRTDDAVAAALQETAPPRMSIDLPPRSDAPARCREFVAQACQQWHIGRSRRLGQLLASELVTNAVVHARTPMVVTVRHVDDALQVSVRDGDPRLVHRPPRDAHRLPEGDPGRGTLLLETLADDWGCTPTADGKVMWASVAAAAKVPDGSR